jgi:hypothetical protein
VTAGRKGAVPFAEPEQSFRSKIMHLPLKVPKNHFGD